MPYLNDYHREDSWFGANRGRSIVEMILSLLVIFFIVWLVYWLLTHYVFNTNNMYNQAYVNNDVPVYTTTTAVPQPIVVAVDANRYDSDDDDNKHYHKKRNEWSSKKHDYAKTDYSHHNKHRK